MDAVECHNYTSAPEINGWPIFCCFGLDFALSPLPPPPLWLKGCWDIDFSTLFWLHCLLSGRLLTCLPWLLMGLLTTTNIRIKVMIYVFTLHGFGLFVSCVSPWSLLTITNTGISVSWVFVESLSCVITSDCSSVSLCLCLFLCLSLSLSVYECETKAYPHWSRPCKS